MKSGQLRKIFLDYFSKQKHTIIPSDSLIPSRDPSLLFTSAGMVQFKKNFLGQGNDALKRAASVQKCLRTSDIDQIGKTNRHLSFFEMCGNFSFGDYFKTDAIKWAWEFLVNEVGIDKKKLYISVYKNDDEAFDIWSKILPKSRIYRLGDETNFWNMGPTGPCGPCSEILYDQGTVYSCGKKSCGPACDCDRYLEVWNLVFTQFDKKQNGTLQTLPRKNIDTGMGFERLLSIHQGVDSTFSTDLFNPVIEHIKETVKTNKKGLPHFRLIADHTRAVVFMASEGILPSNEGRGYIFRRLLRRALRNSRLLGINEPFLYKLVPMIVEIMKDPYDELSSRRENIISIIKAEEERFLDTLESGLKQIYEIMHELNNKGTKNFPAEGAFKLFDTYGFPIEITKEIADEKGLSVDIDQFNKLIEESKNVSRKSWKGSGERDMSLYDKIQKKVGDVKFTGYDSLTSKAEIIAIIENGKEIKELKQGGHGEIVLNETSFYPESGGQAGDKGRFIIKDAIADVSDTQRPVEGLIVHTVNLVKGGCGVGDEVEMVVNDQTRRSTMRHHTATHLLHRSLREVFGIHVVQSGSFVNSEKLRFDYTHMKSPSQQELDLIEEQVNQMILKATPVHIITMDIEKAKERGAIALFGEKYGSQVRCIIVGDSAESSKEDVFSMELCGGTHVKNTSEIGIFKILSEGSISSGVRRIEAIAGFEVFKYLKKLEFDIETWAHHLKVKTIELPIKLKKMSEKIKQLEKEAEYLNSQLISGNTKKFNFESNILSIKSIKVYSDFIENSDIKSLRNQIDLIKKQVGADLCLLANKSSFVISVSKEAEEKGFNATTLAKEFAADVRGSAGGRSDFAQGGGKLPVDTNNYIKDWLKKKLNMLP
ncbi:MAG: alanine--tRNA ligase [bacterium]